MLPSIIPLITLIIFVSSVDLIFDADFGGPIDDTFAVSYLLKKYSSDPSIFNIRLISMVGRNTTARATILAKFLTETGYDWIDIGVGPDGPCGNFFSIECVGPAWPWMDTFDDEFTLDDYEGVVYENGVERIIEILEEYSAINPIYVVTVGALTNLATVISDRPELKQNMRLFTMSGSLFSDTEPFGKFVEFNILDDIPSAQIVYNDREIDEYYTNLCAVPWDTGYYFQIEGDNYQRLLDGMDDNKIIKNMIEMYDVWYINGGYAFDSGRIFHPNNASASMYDLQMIWLAIAVAELDIDEEYKSCGNITSYLIMGEFDVEVNNTGYIWPIDDLDGEIPFVYFAENWKPNGIVNLAEEIVDILLYPDDNIMITTETPTTDSKQ